MLKALSVFGTRPEAIKMAPVVRAPERSSEIHSRVCVTAQHRQMLDQVLSLFGITPDFDLNVMRPGQGLTDMTSSILAGLQGGVPDRRRGSAIDSHPRRGGLLPAASCSGVPLKPMD